MSELSRREAVISLGLVAVASVGASRLLAQTKPMLTVYKDPNCGCCAKWVDHMKANGFAATVNETTDMDAIKSKYHVTDNLRSCHTTLVGNYVIEGHVPAADVKRLLAEKPANVSGLAAPGMPASSPGMDLTPFVPYDVVSFDSKGKSKLFAKHTKV